MLDITEIVITIGYFTNAHVYLITDSFIVEMTGTWYGSMSEGITRTYEPDPTTSYSVTGTSTQAGDISTYLFTFLLSFNLVSNSYFELYFPLSSWSLAPQFLNTAVTVNKYGTTYTGSALTITYHTTNTSILYITGVFPTAFTVNTA